MIDRSDTGDAPAEADNAIAVIKKYPNRRLYDTGSSRYVTLDDVAMMVRDGKNFQVADARTGEDLTRAVLTQIIVEQEGRGPSMLSIAFLRQIIGLYGDNLGRVVPHYLEHTMQSFSRNEERLRTAMKTAWDGLISSLPVDEAHKRNQTFFENARGLFRSFQGPERAALIDDADQTAEDREITTLRRRINSLERELAERLAARDARLAREAEETAAAESETAPSAAPNA